MKYARYLFHFLGSIHFAVILLGVVTLCVVMGTFIESATGSHLNASRFTYHNPAFTVLLWFFFVNILVSTLRRWPFRAQHIPFIITHIGLLMVLGGTLIKYQYGTQATLGLLEGATNDTAFETDTYCLRIEQPGKSNSSEMFEIPTSFTKQLRAPFTPFTMKDGTLVEVVGFAPHCEERLSGWIHDGRAIIAGLPPITAHNAAPGVPIVPSMRTPLFNSDERQWTVYALTATDPAGALRQIVLQSFSATLIHPSSGQVVEQTLLVDLVDTTISTPVGEVSTTLSLPLAMPTGLTDPNITLTIDESATVTIPLSGPSAATTLASDYGSPPLECFLQGSPTLVIIQDVLGDEVIVTIDPHGRIDTQLFNQSTPHPIIVYEDGLKGYGISTELKLASSIQSPHSTYLRRFDLLRDQLQEILTNAPLLSPPLELLRKASEEAGVPFLETCISFLYEWDRSGTWLYPIDRPLPAALSQVLTRIHWSESDFYTGARWIAELQIQLLERVQKKGEKPFSALAHMDWPLVSHLREIHPDDSATPELLVTMGQQVLAVAHELPELPVTIPRTAQESALLLSALLRTFDFHFQNLAPELSYDAGEPKRFETFLTVEHTPLSPSAKLESNRPLLTLRFTRPDGTTTHSSVAYDRYAQGLKWPILDGTRLIRFQPKFITLPYSVRLHDARQINYASTQQAFSYEADVTIGNEPSTVSMNNVHETWDGYRFYLANLSPPNEVTAQRAQIVVNRDPVKYWITYPGGIILALGIVLLFWVKPYR